MAAFHLIIYGRFRVITEATDYVTITGSGEGHLYAIHPPNFTPSN
jgi:hypothetical protein